MSDTYCTRHKCMPISAPRSPLTLRAHATCPRASGATWVGSLGLGAGQRRGQLAARARAPPLRSQEGPTASATASVAGLPLAPSTAAHRKMKPVVGAVGNAGAAPRRADMLKCAEVHHIGAFGWVIGEIGQTVFQNWCESADNSARRCFRIFSEMFRVVQTSLLEPSLFNANSVCRPVKLSRLGYFGRGRPEVDGILARFRPGPAPVGQSREHVGAVLANFREASPSVPRFGQKSSPRLEDVGSRDW